MTPSEGTPKVILTAEEELRRRSARLDSAQRSVLETTVLDSIGASDVLRLGRHTLNSQYSLDNHNSDLIRLLVRIFHHVRLHHQAKLRTARLQKGQQEIMGCNLQERLR